MVGVYKGIKGPSFSYLRPFSKKRGRPKTSLSTSIISRPSPQTGDMIQNLMDAAVITPSQAEAAKSFQDLHGKFLKCLDMPFSPLKSCLELKKGYRNTIEFSWEQEVLNQWKDLERILKKSPHVFGALYRIILENKPLDTTKQKDLLQEGLNILLSHFAVEKKTEK